MQMFGAKVFQAEATAGASLGLRGTIRRPDGRSREKKWVIIVEVRNIAGEGGRLSWALKVIVRLLAFPE